MKHLLMIWILVFTGARLCAQVNVPASTATEQKLESNTESNADLETEDDAWLQQLHHFIKDPLNLNTAVEQDLVQLQILTPLQAGNFFSYRKIFGPFLSIYELQAIPGWNLQTLQKIRPFVCVSTQQQLVESVKARLKNGEHSLLFRSSQVLEKAKGYRQDTSAASHYPGSPQKILLRYQYRYKGLLQYGVLGEKDPGEQFFKGKQKIGFDFYSAHVFLRDIGIIRALALGDFTVNMGQGLVQWQGLAFKKNSEALHIKRESAILRPYHSSGEINFHRGIGVTLGKNNWEATFFTSLKKTDANLVIDTTQAVSNFVSSLQSSGYHRTKLETDDKGIQRQCVFGGNFNIRLKHLHLGLNAIHYQFKLPLVKADYPYNKYALSGKSFSNYSIDYSYTFKNFHFFGEAATDAHFNRALVSGVLLSVAAEADISLLYRNISSAYQALQADAFTESAGPGNEKGIYAGMEIRPNDYWTIDAYVDLYKFPWLRYRIDAPANGADYLVQATYRPNKQLEIYSRFHSRSKPVNTNPDQSVFPAVEALLRQDWCIQLSFKLSPGLVLRNRTGLVWFDKKGRQAEQGFLANADIMYNPPFKRYSGNLRIAYFETGGYNSRFYVYENDVLYNFSIPVTYDKGVRYYLNFNYDINKKLTIWARWAQTIFKGKSLIGSGLDEIRGNKKTEFTVQFMHTF